MRPFYLVGLTEPFTAATFQHTRTYLLSRQRIFNTNGALPHLTDSPAICIKASDQNLDLARCFPTRHV
jgi:hypothetical protein